MQSKFKYFLVLISTLTLSVRLYSQDPKLFTIRDINTGCSFYTSNPYITYGKWNGKCAVGGYINGNGVMRCYDENSKLVFVSHCSYINGKRNGFSIDSFYNGNYYSGNYVNGFRSGQGKMVYTDGSYYEGDFRNSLPNGKGSYKKVNGSLYIGEVKDGKENGFGKCIYEDGSYYEGNWIESIPSKPGKLVFTDGSYFALDDGIWDAGGFSGRGKIFHKNSDYYEGGLKNSQPHGHGKLLLKDGTSLEGEWENGNPNGTGKIVNPDGVSHEVICKDGNIKLQKISNEFNFDNACFYCSMTLLSELERLKNSKDPNYTNKGILLASSNKGDGKCPNCHGNPNLGHHSVSCPSCNYWTETQRMYNACSQCKNSKYILVSGCNSCGQIGNIFLTPPIKGITTEMFNKRIRELDGICTQCLGTGLNEKNGGAEKITEIAKRILSKYGFDVSDLYPNVK